MKNPTRITIALDEETSSIIEELKIEKKVSQSELIRQALRFYHENLTFAENSVGKKLNYYVDMLVSGEHIILDVDHWLLFLKLVESSPDKDDFWEECREIARSHAEQLKERIETVEDLLERLEACNFFRVTKNSKKKFTLVLGSEAAKKFVITFLEEFFSAMEFITEINENIAKIRISIKS